MVDEAPMMKLLLALSLLCYSVCPMPARAAGPLDSIKPRVDQVLAVLKDSSLKGEAGKELKRKRLRSIFDTTFDYLELSKGTLSRNWDKLRPDQQKEFQELYTALLEKVYVDLLLLYTDQKVVFGKERALGENKMEVETKVISASLETPVHFRMISKGGQWWVYDFVVEGISVVSNYRSQFNRILAKESLESMLGSLRKQALSSEGRGKAGK